MFRDNWRSPAFWRWWWRNSVPAEVKLPLGMALVALLLVGGYFAAGQLSGASASNSTDSYVLQTTVRKVVTVRQHGKLVVKRVPVVIRRNVVRSRTSYQTVVNTRVVTTKGGVQRVVKVFAVGGGLGMPQDVKLSPDGRVFYVADMVSNGVWLVGAKSFRIISFVHTGRGAHGLYPSRDARYLYVSNRGDGSISVLSFASRKVVRTWRLPGGGSPDMGGVSADGKVLWLSGRYNRVVYAISTRDGTLLARIPVGAGPHGLCVWPQPGRYSLGHTGILR